METIESFSEHQVREAVRCVFRERSASRFKIIPMVAGVLLLLLAALAFTGLVDARVPIAVAVGLITAAAVTGVMTLVARRQYTNFALRVMKNVSHGNVVYDSSSVGCRARYGGTEALLPWSNFVSRRPCGERTLLKFEMLDGHADQQRLKVIADAMTRGVLAPELLGFPVFCLLPNTKYRYLLVPAKLLDAAPEHVRA